MSSQSQLFPINLQNLTDKERHKFILNHYVLATQAENESRKHKRDIDVIRENHRFLWEDDNLDSSSLSWEQRLALRYYKKLFKEYCIADLTRYKDNKIALRWRTKQEVVTGIGQFQCGSRHCSEKEDLRTWEVNFKYIEQGAPQNALVKIRLCPNHTQQLNYRTKKREIKRQKKRAKEERKTVRKQKRRKVKDQEEPSAKEDSDDEEGQDPQEAAEKDKSQNESSATSLEQSADDQIWLKQADLSQEQPSREQEFERYLEDLLL
ncbi:protein FRA10AC1 homolog [Drosophila tropicalis]|uniref:protein FRA10AC1 homolog n=1 Tax=Drosophila tropicalis TaxID=46794 RepID=UPI0035ABE8B3